MASTAKLMGTSFKAGRRVPRKRRAGRRIKDGKGGAEAVRSNPYLQALMHDRALHSNLEAAYGSLSKAYERAAKKDLGADLLEDRKARRELGRATASLRAASERLSAARSRRRRSRGGRTVLLVAVAGGVGALALSEDLRGRVVGLVSGGGGSSDQSSNGTGRSAAPQEVTTPEGATSA
jgi:hypothetical protein